MAGVYHVAGSLDARLLLIVVTIKGDGSNSDRNGSMFQWIPVWEPCAYGRFHGSVNGLVDGGEEIFRSRLSAFGRWLDALYPKRWLLPF